MKIWVIHHYADPPDGHWTGTFELYKHLIKKGHEVKVFSSSFSHYSRKEERLKKNEMFTEGEYEGVKFVFVRSTPYLKNDWRRFLGMISFAYRAYIIGMKNKEQPDVIVGSTPHPFCALSALILAWRKKAKFFLELHDLWLQYMLDTGSLSPKHPATLLLKKIDQLLYDKASAILTLWPKMNNYLKLYGVPQEKVVWMPLGVDSDKLREEKLNPVKEMPQLTIVCTARLGPASNVHDILEAIKMLKGPESDKIKVVIVGGGPEEDNLKRYADQYGLKNVEFKGLVRKEEIPAYLADADVCIAGLPDVANYKEYGTIPTKVLDYMASNRPTIFLATVKDSIVERAKAGLVVPPANPSKLANAFLKLASMSAAERRQMAQNGIDYLKEFHDLHKLADRLNNTIEKYARE